MWENYEIWMLECRISISYWKMQRDFFFGIKRLTISVMCLVTLRACHLDALSPISLIVLWSAENIMPTLSEQQSVLTSTSHLPKRPRHLNKKTQMKSPSNIKNKGNMNENMYFLNNRIRLFNSSIEPPTSKKSSITVVSTPFLAHDMRASDSSGWKIVAAAEK